MKPSFFTLLFALVCSFSSYAQIHIGSRVFAAMNNPGSLSEDDIKALRGTTTLFVLPAKDYEKQADFEKAIHSVWTITPFKIVKASEVDALLKTGSYSVFSPGAHIRQEYTRNSIIYYALLSYDLWMPKHNKKGEMKGQNFYSRITLFPDNETAVGTDRFTLKKDGEEMMARYMAEKGAFYNWGAGYLKGYLKHVNDHLWKRDAQGPFSDLENSDALKALAKDTLYIPDYLSLRVNMLTGAVTIDEDDEALAKAYPFPVKWVSSTQLNDLIVNGTKPIHYILYTKMYSNKFINVFSTGDKNLIYSEYVKLSVGFKNKDLKKLAKAIK